jgi:hypothetical protein
MAADPNNDPFASIGGGVYVNGGWVPKGHAGAQGATSTQPPAGGAAPDPSQPAATSVNQQAQNASTYSQTPGAAQADYTVNQGTQDVVRNSWLEQATQGTQVDRNDPNFKQQLDPFVAAQDRARRQYESEQAERTSAQGLGNSGAMDQERRLGMERAGQAAGAFESQLVTRELQNRREEIQTALTSLGGLVSADQEMALKRELADLDAALKREGIDAQTGLGYAELGVKDKLGTGALNVDLLRALLQNQQNNDGQALAWSQFDWTTSPMNPRNW